ncbi:glycosyltransferase WbuB [Cryobacterium sinapicolor]|uniref:D-inositol 3-phosphate glycosyltransferase n=1 Tax=Cryobacterium sinapicolor TaxID=1259236 RepID=A0ABY2ITT9_9MICO|nr:glycosyltransferase family 4 protein [Cryobacterium sinapicolor]TFC94711.1 glycosyltransferase WbuB [Cryobacterium sinapicolor]
MVISDSTLKIVIVTQYYKPEHARIPVEIARSLAERGHEVRVVTGYPNYPEGRLYPEYRQRLRHHEWDGAVRVRRVPIVVSHSQNALARFANYVSFAVSSLGASRFVADADVVYVYATQMTASLAPCLWRVTRGIPFVLHIQDLWPESVTGSSMVSGSLAKRLINGSLRPWLGAVYRRSSAVIATAPTMARMLVDRGVESRKVYTVLNWAEERGAQEQRGGPAGPAGAGTGLSLVYAGNLGEFQDLDTVIRAGARSTGLEGFTLTIVGSGVAEEGLKRLAQELGASSIVFRGRVPHADMDEIYAASDFQVVPLRDLEIFRGTIPSKFQGSLANGIPVITTVAGDVSAIVRTREIGFASAPGDVDALAASFRSAYALSSASRRLMGERARAYYTAEMSRDAGVERIEEILRSAAQLRTKKAKN